ncbi:MAG: molybdate ABC transporter permease subunit [bacterium]|nr:molybdate ABC transporter permease subunit [bacterium]
MSSSRDNALAKAKPNVTSRGVDRSGFLGGALATIAVLFFLLPLIGLAARAPWDEPGRFFAAPIVEALLLSLGCATAAAFLAALFGLPLAMWLAARDTFSRRLVRVLVTLPLVMPPVVVGVALLAAYGRNGLVGGPAADALGIVLPYSIAGVVIAEAYVAMPFFVLAAEAGLRGFDGRYSDVAATLGASRWWRYRSVVLPMLLPTFAAALVVAWARALGEFGATVTFAGNLAGSTRTMPLAIFVALESDLPAAVALSLVLVGVSATILFCLRDRWLPRGRSR